MEKLGQVSSIVMPLNRPNVDTDQIVPKQFLKLVQRTGFGKFLFYDWRFDQNNSPRKEFVLNDPKYIGSQILISGDNFGCGSSREHAAWAIKDYGFDVIIAPSFADIFYNNCFKNGILPISLQKDIVNDLMKTDSIVHVDLASQTIQYNLKSIHFDIDESRKKTLLEGLDDIAVTLQHENKITQFEKSHIL
ncbi:MAG: 3-isopropylmalate dehydratase small subunit [Thaumarchaeota archaeon]|nr:3-isopropylmalate dehydratase small subunit [Nitrososphaerota archaeon]